MKFMRFLICITTVVLFNVIVCMAESKEKILLQNNSNIIWGDATNGIRIGCKIVFPGSEGSGLPKEAEYITYLQNVGTNYILYRLKHTNNLYDSGWNNIRLQTDFPAQNQRVLTKLKQNEISQTGFGKLVLGSEKKSNSLFHILIKAQAATNKWHGHVTYFDLPPVTNTFCVQTNGTYTFGNIDSN